MKLTVAVLIILAIMAIGVGAWVMLIVLEGWKTALTILVIIWMNNIHIERRIEKAIDNC
jgi:hypothetical protein